MAKNIDITKLTDEQRTQVLREVNRKNGLKGGLVVKQRGRDYYREIGKKGALKRWGNKQQNESSE